MASDLMRTIQKMLAPLRARIEIIISRGVLRKTDSGPGTQKVQVELQPGEVPNDIEHLEPYGFTSRPLVGAEVLTASMGGDRNRLVAFLVSDLRKRKKGLSEGEVALYTDEGDYIIMKRGRIVEVFAGAKVKVTAPIAEIVASTKVTITSPLTEMSGNATVGGNLTVAGDATAANVTASGTVTGTTAVKVGTLDVGTHKHSGVTVGAGTSGGPVP